MFKKFVCLLMSVLIVLSLFSCGKGGKTVSVSDGKGGNYTVCVDKDGFIETNEYGKMVTYSADEDGNIEKDENGDKKTEAIDFPYCVTYDDKAQCSDFYLTVPEGWKISGSQMIKLVHDETGAEIGFTLRTTDSVDKCVSDIKELYEDWEPAWNESDVEFGFGNAKLLSSSKILENAVKYFYVFAVNEKSYIVQATIYGGLSDGVDFKEIINSMCFRNSKGS